MGFDKEAFAAYKKNFKAADENNNSGFGETYPFWQMNDGEQAIVRFLPDANEDNPKGFLVEKLMHTLHVNGQRRSVPCLKMYDQDNDCPICKLSSEYYNADDKVNGKKYWRNKQHIARALIVKDPLSADADGNTHEGQIRTIPLSWQVYECIQDAFESGELEYFPFDYDYGYNFIIKKKVNKTPEGEQASYVRSKFENKQTAISEYINVDDIELKDIASFLPQEPEASKVAEWLEADVTGKNVTSSHSNSSPNPKPSGDNIAAKLDSLKSSEPAKESAPTNTNDDVDEEADAILNEIFANR